MKAHVEAVAARLAPIATTYLVSAPPDRLPPYFIVEPTAATTDPDRSVTPRDATLVFDVRVKAVGGSSNDILVLRGRGLAELSPDGSPTVLAVAGRGATIVHHRFEAAYVDDSITLPTSNRHPAVAVDTYQVWSSPE